MAENSEVATTIATIGPELCSSNESDSDGEVDKGSDSTIGSTERTMGDIASWRGKGVTSCLNVLQANHLYCSQRNRLGCSHPSKRPPPDGTPLSWISPSYLNNV
jgi:hypothetical protein